MNDRERRKRNQGDKRNEGKIKLKKLKLNFVTFSLQANYTDRAIAACGRS
jgi:hypothetical protein